MFSVIDLIILVLAIGFAITGYRQGFVVSALSFVGFLGGAALAVQGLRQKSIAGGLLAGIGGSLSWWALTGEGDLSEARRWFGQMVERAPPGVRMVSTYRAAWLPRDVVAGLVLTALLVPQGMAYAELAGLPAITGLYTSILCLIGYTIFGPSRILVLGPDSSLGPMIAATILPLVGANGDPQRAVELASMLALIVGALSIVIWDTGFWVWVLQVLAFLLLSLVSAFVGKKIMSGRGNDSDQPLLNKRGDQLIGRTATLTEPIANGRGRVKIGDTMWRVSGPDLPPGTTVRVKAATDLDLELVVEPV